MEDFDDDFSDISALIPGAPPPGEPPPPYPKTEPAPARQDPAHVPPWRRTQVEKIGEIAREADAQLAPTDGADGDEHEADTEAQTAPRRPRLVTVRASDVQPQKVEWLWPHRFALGALSLIAGQTCLGKSQTTLFIAAAVTNGSTWPNGEGVAPSGSVIILSAEDDTKRVLVPRLMAAGADMDRVHIVEAVSVPAVGGDRERLFNVASDVQALCDKVDEIGDVRLVIIDPITAYLGNSKAVDSNKNADVRDALAPLMARAEKLGFAWLAVSHLNKGGGTEALTRVMGSLAFVAASRTAYLVVADRDNERSLFIAMKSNLSSKRTGLAYRVISKVVAGDIETSAIQWDSDEVTTTADEALAAAAGKQGGGDDGAQGSVAEAMNFLRDLLSDGPVSAKEVENQAKEAAITKATLRRAKKAMGVMARHRGDGGTAGHGEWIWEMPPQIVLRRTDIDD